MTITTHCNVILSYNAPPLDGRQAATAAHSIAGGTVRPDKHCGSCSRLQLQSPRSWSGFKILLAKMLAAEVRVGCGDPLCARALDLFLPFAKLIGVLGEFEQCHTIFCSFATSICHTVIGHPVFSNRGEPPSPKQNLQPVQLIFFKLLGVALRSLQGKITIVLPLKVSF